MSMYTRSILALACLLVPCLADAAPIYSLTPIDPGNLGGSLWPRAINNRGEVSGNIVRNAPDPSRPFFWNGTGPARELAVPAGTGASALGMNNLGEVVGQIGNDSAIWSPDGTVRTIAPPAGHTLAFTAGLNDAGTLLTRTESGPLGGGVTGFRRHADGSVEELPNFYSQALNQRGAALGIDAVVWEPDGTLRSLTSPGSPNGYAINDAGWVTGQFAVGDDISMAVWRPDGSLIAVPPPGNIFGGDYVSGVVINNRQEVVGGGKWDGVGRIVYWTEADGLVDLRTRLDASSAGWRLDYAIDINDAGQIVGIAIRTSDNRSFAVVLTPVPEPSLALACVGVLAVLATRRRARN
jgi:hypothetical protein